MSATMYGSTPGAGAGQAIFTDDVSLQVFMEYLKRLVRMFDPLEVASTDVFYFYRLSALRRIDLVDVKTAAAAGPDVVVFSFRLHDFFSSDLEYRKKWIRFKLCISWR